MSVLNLKYYGEPVLREKAKPVEKIEDHHRKLIEDMIETMKHENGIGIAANQIGSLDRIIIVFDTPMINPEIISYGKTKHESNEGCLSLPGIRAYVERPIIIKVKFQDVDGKEVVADHEGLMARCTQHEVDHLNGVLFIDRIADEWQRVIEEPIALLKRLQEEKGRVSW